ncbi:MAG: hypothetical protein JNK37_00655 [Verrucomicrobiales bacterium]|nr:hypothetical protein [Verrucomicrobiales bacterium]
MAQDLFSTRPVFGRTFTSALWVLGTLAVLQVAMAGWAILTRPSQPAPEPAPLAAGPPVPPPPAQIQMPTVYPAKPYLPSAEPPPAPEPQTAPLSQTVDVPPSPGVAAPPNPPLGADFSPSVTTGAVPPMAAPPALGESLLPGPRYAGAETVPPLSTLLTEAALAAPPALGIPDPEVAAMVDTGAELRSSGNMQGSLDSLRQAEALLPEHPRVLSEIAATYDQLGLDRKSTLYWERVRDLGADKAGAWHPIALGELSGHRAGGAKRPPVLKLGKIETLHDPAIREGQGERVVLSVSILADPASRPSASEMSMLVYFYDLVNGEKTEASTADTAQQFVSKPYDWASEGSERIEVIYHQPVFTPEQKRELGERAFYGYIVELYYRDELQDTAAFPPDLKNLNPGSTPTPMSEPPLGPDNSLFPTVPNAPE